MSQYLPVSGPQLLRLFHHAQNTLASGQGAMVARSDDAVQLCHEIPDESLQLYRPYQGVRQDEAALVCGADTPEHTELGVREHVVYDQMIPIGSHQTVRTAFDRTYETRFSHDASSPDRLGVTIYHTAHAEQGHGPIVFSDAPVTLTLDATTGEILAPSAT